jgi:nucleoside-diphosphate-sugar epimerase
MVADPILVLGATGGQGGTVTGALLDRGAPVRGALDDRASLAARCEVAARSAAAAVPSPLIGRGRAGAMAGAGPASGGTAVIGTSEARGRAPGTTWTDGDPFGAVAHITAGTPG